MFDWVLYTLLQFNLLLDACLHEKNQHDQNNKFCRYGSSKNTTIWLAEHDIKIQRACNISLP